jgi:putative PIN family toxin of toxin-antitoxin system
LFGGNSENVVKLCLARVEIIASETIAEEIYDYLKNETKAPHRWRRFFRNTFERICTVIPSGKMPDVVRDPKDNHVVAAAVESKSKFIITGDKDLLELENHSGIRILSPAEFLDLSS